MTPNRFPDSRPLRALAVLVPLAVLGDALWVRAALPAAPPWQGLDDAWNGLVGGPEDEAAWQAAQLLNRFGAQPGLAVLAVAVVVLLVLRRWRSAVFALLTVPAVTFAVDGLKAVADRARPDDVTVATASAAFPSGHSARMAAFVVIVAVVAVPARHLRIWWPVAAALTFAMMLARTWQHAHWLTDTVAGAAVGWAVALLVWWACSPLLDRERALREALGGPPLVGADRLP